MFLYKYVFPQILSEQLSLTSPFFATSIFWGVGEVGEEDKGLLREDGEQK